MAPVVVTQTDDSDKSKDHKMWIDHISEDEKAFCYTCNSTAEGKDLPHHLFLGRLDCIHCTVKIATCDYFQEVFYSSTHKCKQNKSGKHEFSKWQTSCTEYLSYFLRRELVIERFCRNLKGSPSAEEVLVMVRDYMCKLSAIEKYDPWKTGLQDCWKYLERKNLGKQSRHSSKDSQNSNYLESEELSNSENLLEENRLSKVSTQDKTVNGSNNSADSSQKETLSSSGESQSINDSGEDRRDLFKYRIQHMSKDPYFPKSVTVSHQSSTGTPLTDKETVQVDENVREILSDESLEQDEPDDELLSAFTIGGLDQTIEYVTIQDACREKADGGVNESLISENQESFEISSGKRKVINESSGGVRKRKCHKHDTQNLNDFWLPDGIIKNDNYLVIRFPTESCPEECPNCYCEFTPSMLTVNCSTFVSTIICEECKLTIYVLPE